MKHKIADFLNFIVTDIDRTDFWGICSQMAFYLLMSFFPLIIFIVNFVGQFVLQSQHYLFDVLKNFLPTIAYNYVYSFVLSMPQTIGDNHYFLLIMAFFFSTLAARATMIGMNLTYGYTERRSRKKLWALSFIFTLAFAITILFILSAFILSQNLTAFVLGKLGLSVFSYQRLNVLTFVFSFLVTVLVCNLIYILAPAKRLSFRHGLPGALFSAAGITIVFRIFLIFVNRSAKYTLLYGSFGGLFALLVVIYFLCVILNLGGKINVYCNIDK
ncbi:MAG: YihY/virulence factor BrkB family protein [Eubacterium sp.]|nr:YihY/virulence factor BrkB family protein [Eubacterium sp.]